LNELAKSQQEILARREFDKEQLLYETTILKLGFYMIIVIMIRILLMIQNFRIYHLVNEIFLRKNLMRQVMLFAHTVVVLKMYLATVIEKTESKDIIAITVVSIQLQILIQ